MDIGGVGTRRGRTTTKKGHVLSGYNSYITKTGGRVEGWKGILFQSFFLLPPRTREEGRRKRVKN